MEIAVYLYNRLKQSKFHGNIEFEIATVWDQPGLSLININLKLLYIDINYIIR